MAFMSSEQYAWVQNALIDLGVAVNNGFARVEVRLDRLEVRMDRVEGRLDRVEGRLDSLERRVTNLEAGVDDVRSRLARLESPKRKR